MNQNIFFNKWWLLLLQGVLLLLLSYEHFNNNELFVSTVSVTTGFIGLLNSCSLLIGYFLTEREESNHSDLILGIIGSLIGVLLIANLYFDKTVIIWFLISYMIINSMYLITNTWQLKSSINWWWFSFLFCVCTILLSLYIVTRLTFSSKTISLIVGFQFFGNGVLLVLLAFVLRKLQNDYGKTIEQIKNNVAH